MMSQKEVNVNVGVRDSNFEDNVRISSEQREKVDVLTGDGVAVLSNGEKIVKRVRSVGNPSEDRVLLTEAQMEALGVESGDEVTIRKARESEAPTDVRKNTSMFSNNSGRSGPDVENKLKKIKNTMNTTKTAEKAGVEPTEEDTGGLTYDDVGGLDEELQKIREMIELPLTEPDLFNEFGVDPPKGVLLHGPPGTGKTLTAKAIANETSARFFSIQGPEVMSRYKGQSEKELRQIFEKARSNGPAIIFFDEIDAIAPKRGDNGESENRLVSQLLSLMDGMKSQEGVVVIGATNRVDSIDPALRRGGRFDRELEIGVPDEKGRREVLEVLTSEMPLNDDVSLDQLASRTHGFVGADLDALTREAGLDALQRVGENSDQERVVSMTDFTEALADVEASAMREVVSESPEVTFDDVGGLDQQKRRLKENIEWPIQYDSLYDTANAEAPAGVLLHGPQGVGKTTLARAMAGETDVNFIQVRGPELVNKYVGESEKAVRELFDKARQTSPSILFFDELDAVASGGQHEVTERVIAQMVAELDSLRDNPNVTVLAATEEPEDIDGSLRGPGRFEELVEVSMPDFGEKVEILRVLLDDKPVSEDVTVEKVGEMFDDGTTGADIEAVVRGATIQAIRRVARDVDPDEANEHADEVKIKMQDLVDQV